MDSSETDINFHYRSLSVIDSEHSASRMLRAKEIYIYVNIEMRVRTEMCSKSERCKIVNNIISIIFL